MSIAGLYECTGYAGTPNQNDWHFVTIREQGDGSLNWSNRAGVSWGLLPDGADQFVPAAGAPYPELVYNLVRDSGGQVTGIMKGGEAYGRVGDIQVPQVAGLYECTGYVGTPNQNDWHFVTIREQGDGSLNWSNRAGVSWVLLPDGADQFVPAAGAPYAELVYNLVRGSGGGVTGIMQGGEAHGRVGANNLIPSAVSDDNLNLFMQRWWPNADHFVHRHDDGTLKLLWRIKMLEYDEKTGHIHAQVKSASFVVELPEGGTLQDHALQVDLQRVQQRFATSQLQA
jgi:hypothetical protein